MKTTNLRLHASCILLFVFLLFFRSANIGGSGAAMNLCDNEKLHRTTFAFFFFLVSLSFYSCFIYVSKAPTAVAVAAAAIRLLRTASLSDCHFSFTVVVT